MSSSHWKLEPSHSLLFGLGHCDSRHIRIPPGYRGLQRNTASSLYVFSISFQLAGLSLASSSVYRFLMTFAGLPWPFVKGQRGKDRQHKSKRQYILCLYMCQHMLVGDAEGINSRIISKVNFISKWWQAYNTCAALPLNPCAQIICILQSCC